MCAAVFGDEGLCETPSKRENGERFFGTTFSMLSYPTASYKASDVSHRSDITKCQTSHIPLLLVIHIPDSRAVSPLIPIYMFFLYY